MALRPAQITDNMRRLMCSTDKAALGKEGLTHEELCAIADARNEKQLHQQIEDFLHRAGVTFYVHGRMDKKATITVGTPDFIIPLDNGVTLWLEVKFGKNTCSHEQLQVLQLLKDKQHKTLVTNNYREAIDFIKQYL